MSLISVNKLTFSYDTNFDYIFKDVSFQIDTDWKLGFIGRNGRGKTTFLNLLLGKYEFSGTISAPLAFDYFPFEVKDKSKKTLEIIGDIVPFFEEWALNRELNHLEVDLNCLNRPFQNLSGGEQSKILLAALFLKEGNFLLIDEPTNHLDSRARQIVSEYLSGKKGYILVSHDRAFLDGCIDHVLSINRADIELQKGNFSSWLLNKERQDSFEKAQNEKLAGDIDRLKKAAKRKSDWSDRAEKGKIGSGACDRGFIGAKAAKVMKTSKAIEKRRDHALEEKSKLLHNLETAEELKIQPLLHHAERLAEIRDLSIFFGEREVCSSIGFDIRRGDRISVLGKNGSGKTSVLKAVAGEKIHSQGTVMLASGLKISYVPQDTSFLRGNLTDFARENGVDETLFKTILFKFDFSRAQFEKDMSDFSGGQKKKVLIAKSLCENAHLYIWDEPLNYIDVLSRMQIEELILSNSPTMLFVEHDQAFTTKVATKTVEL